MHYYKFNIADYRADTSHLDLLEHGIYRQLIDWYYLDEAPIPLETTMVMRRLRLESGGLSKLMQVLSDFFVKTEKGYIHKRIDSEIEAYNKQSAHNREAGKLGGRPKKTTMVSEKTQVVTKHNPNITLTNNHKPLDSSKEKITKKKTSYPSIFTPCDTAVSKLENAGLSVISEIAKFRDYCLKENKTYADWQAAFRNWASNAADWKKPVSGSQVRQSNGLIL